MNKNKKGWIKIVESSTSVLLIAMILLILISDIDLSVDTSQQIYDVEYSILRRIQLDKDLRNDVLTIPSLPVEEGDDDFPTMVSDLITNRKPNYLDCKAKICEIKENCVLDDTVEGEEIFVQSALISANSGNYGLRRIKLFCWNI